jgi:hypothetical protein
MTCEKAGEVTAKTRSKFLQLGVLLLRSKSTYFDYVVKVRRYLLYPSKQLYNPQHVRAGDGHNGFCGFFGVKLELNFHGRGELAAGDSERIDNLSMKKSSIGDNQYLDYL